MAISNQEGFPDRGVKQDSVIVDIERLSHVTDKDISPNSRIARSLSRKGSQKGEKKNSIAAISTSHDKATDTEATNGDGSSKGSGGVTTTGKSITVSMMNPVAETLNKQTQMMMTMSSEGRWTSNSFSRRHGGKRPLASFFGPRSVVVFFATLSSVGTILLIYFTLSMKKLGEDDLSGAQLQ